MLSKPLVGSVCAVALLACLGSTPAVAQTFDKQVYFTFSGPVTMPGITLPAGSYFFHVLNPLSGGDVVQVQSADHRHDYGVFLMNRDWARTVPEKPQVRFTEARAKLPQALHSWWYPGQRTGYAFRYRNAQNRRESSDATATSAGTDSSAMQMQMTESDPLEGEHVPVIPSTVVTPTNPLVNMTVTNDNTDVDTSFDID